MNARYISGRSVWKQSLEIWRYVNQLMGQILAVCHGKYEYVVQDHPKTDAGFRTIVIPESYRWVVEKLKYSNPFGEWVFVKRDKKTRATTNTIRTRVRGICKELGIPVRSSHKIRKTYGTILLDNNLDSKLIQSQMGHTNIQVTESFYHRDRKKFDQKKRIIDSIEEFKKTANL